MIKFPCIKDIKYRQMLINVLVYRVYIYDDSLTIMFTTQDTYYKGKGKTINELECSFMGNSLPPNKSHAGII